MPIIGIQASSISGNLSTGNYYNIQTLTGSTSTPQSFTSIPSTYKHLQIRGVWLPSSTVDLCIAVNNTIPVDAQALVGTGTNPPSMGNSDLSPTYGWYVDIGNFTSSYPNYMTPFIVDFYDYASANKVKVGRMQVGTDMSSGDTKSRVGIKTAYWNTTSPISSIVFYQTGSSFNSISHLALYGIE